MSDRFRSVNPPAQSRNRTAAPQSQQPAPARRNLFQSGGGPNARAARRPAAASVNSAETVLDVEHPGSDSSEIVVRDRHGEVEIGDPPTPDLDEECEEDEEGKQEMERTSSHLTSHDHSNES